MVIPVAEWRGGNPAQTKVDKLDVRSARPARAADGRDEERRYGLSQIQYEQCKALGLQVMLAQRKQPDGPQHAAAYAEWDSKCGLQVLLPYAKAHHLKNVPAAPLDVNAGQEPPLCDGEMAVLMRGCVCRVAPAGLSWF